MSESVLQGSATVDELDRRIMHCLQVAPRAPFAAVAGVLEVSEQTVARRFRRMRSEGLVRVIGLVNPSRLGQAGWGLRLRCRPSATREVAAALADRDDVGWVSIAAGGTEILAVLRPRSEVDRDRLMLEQLPRTAQVQDIEAFAYLHIFRGSSTNDWRVGGRLLTDEQLAPLRSTRPTGESRNEGLHEEDEPLLDVLADDGRASYAALAEATGWSQARVARRLGQLLASGVVYLDIDFVMAQFGFRTQAFVTLTVPPARIDAVGRALADQDNVMFVGATTGRTSLAANIACASSEELYALLTGTIGGLAGVDQVSTTLIASTVKQAGSTVEHGRLAAPGRRRGAGRPRTT